MLQRNAVFSKNVFHFGKNLIFALKISHHEETYPTDFLLASAASALERVRIFKVEGHTQGRARDGEAGARSFEAIRPGQDCPLQASVQEDQADD
jgi:hypothetical protein